MTTSKLKVLNKVLSVLLCLAMLLTYLPLSSLTAFAATSHSHPICGAAHTDIGNHTGECGNITWTAWESSDTLPTEAGNYYLTGNVNLGSVVWDVPSGETKICLNGKELKTKKISIASGNTLTISDCGQTGTVKRNGGFGQSGTIVENAGTFNLYGGSITGNTNWYGYGGGVINKSTFNMYGGAVTKNSADRMGGGVYNESGATFNLYDGSITKNSGGTGGGLYNAGKFNMYGGEITGNKTDMDSYGGIYSANRINISGKVVISGNTDKNGDPSNYCSTNNGAVLIVGTLETGSSIGVTRYKNIGTITTGGDEYIDYFFSDNAQYFVEKDGENLKLSEKEFTVDVTVNDNAYGTASANKTSGTKGTQVLLTAEHAEGYRLKEWKLISGGGSLYQSGIFYIGTENAKIQAVFEQAASYTVQFNTGGGTGSKDSVTVFEGDSYTLPANSFTAPTGKQFKAWSVGDKEYAVGDKITILADTTVTAVWEDILTEAPTAKENLVYNGSEQELINAGSAISGTIQYALGTAEAATGEWATDIPKATKVGTYYVWYKVVGDDNYNDVEPAYVAVKIEKAMLTVVQSLAEIDWYPGMSIDYDASALKNLFTVTDANGKSFTFKINAVYNSSNQPIEEIKDAGVYTIELQPFYNSLVGNYSFGTKPLTLTVKPLDLTGQSVTRDTSLDPTYTGETALPLATSSGKLNFDIGKVYDILTKKERSRTLWANDGYWKFEVIEGKNSTDAGDAYISIVGLGGNAIGSCEFKYTIKQQKMAAPEGLVAVDETISKKKDGKISGLTTAMEYSTSKYGTYKPVTDINMLFDADTYYVRTAAPNANYKPSDPVEIIIGEGRKLTVTIPTAEEQIGYALSVNTNEINWHGRVAITFELADGYSKSNTDFAVKVNGTAITLDENDKYIVTGAQTDITITVAGVVDETAPEAEIAITTNKWTEFLNDITFGLFFNETQDVTITATDAGSGVDKIYYYISEDVLTEDEVKALAADKWTLYDADNKPSIDPDKKCVVYAKATDKAQNVKYISSTELVFDSTAPKLYGIEDGGIYYGDKIFKALDDNFLKIEVDGVDITATTQGDDEYKIVADNAEHTVTVTDKAGNVTEYTVTVYKEYSVTFTTEDESGSYEKEFKYGEVITIPTNMIFEDTFRKSGYTLTGWQGYTEGMTMPLDNLTFTAIYTPNSYTVEFDSNGGAAIEPITVIFGEKYGSLPSSSITGLSGGDKNWYLADQNGNATETDTNIKKLTKVSIARNHTLVVKRSVLAPNVSIALTVPGGISDGYQYYIPGASQRVLTATVGNMNTDILNYTYQWYKDNNAISGATSNVLTLDGNVSDSGTYKVEVTATLKDGTNIVVTANSSTGSKEQKVKILHAANTLSYDANGGEGGPQSSYTGGTSLNISKATPTREHYDFIGWNTMPDGNGSKYEAEDVYTFADDGGNGGCVVTLYAQWQLKKYTVTYMADGEPISTEKVEHGKNATLPTVPKKDGYVGKWDSDGKNIVGDTTISAVYTLVSIVKPDEVKPEDKADLENAKAKLEEELKDDLYTEDEKKAIEDELRRIDDALTVIGNVEAVEELIDKLSKSIKKDDEAAIKAANDAYNALSDYEKSLVDKDAKKALDDAVAALAELGRPADTTSPNTRDNSNLWLWIALLFVSGSTVLGITLYSKKRKI